MLLISGTKRQYIRDKYLRVVTLCVSRGTLRRISAKQPNARWLSSCDSNVLGMHDYVNTIL
jgi:hypothetical protein